VFVDLKAAYDTVWRESLLLKFEETVGCSKLFAILNNNIMLSNRFFRVFFGDQCSRWRRLNNGLDGFWGVETELLHAGHDLGLLCYNGLPPHQFCSTFTYRIFRQLVPTYFNYADVIALTFQSRTFEEYENNLESDLEVLNQFFCRWRLQPNPTKTEMCVFHLTNQDANRKLEITFDSTEIQHVNHPKYLGVRLWIDHLLSNRILKKRH
jgi:hypothetical protein